MIIITGALGFIGSCILWLMNKEGLCDILIVDQKDDSGKDKNIENKKFKDFLDKDEFINLARKNKLGKNIDCVIHMGASTSTTESNKDYLMKNNYEYSLSVAKWCLGNNFRFIYASSAATYGDGSLGFSDEDSVSLKLKPLNLYGLSKQLFDLWVINSKLQDRMVGLKFFNVYGPNEYHKADMRSLVCKKFDEIRDTGKIKLFKSYKKEYKDGEQRRDFIYVKDAVNIVWFFFENRESCGIYNVGTGSSHSWNELAGSMFKYFKKSEEIEYFDMSDNIREHYQYITEARVENLRKAGYKKEFWKFEDAVLDYCKFLEHKSYL